MERPVLKASLSLGSIENELALEDLPRFITLPRPSSEAFRFLQPTPFNGRNPGIADSRSGSFFLFCPAAFLEFFRLGFSSFLFESFKKLRLETIIRTRGGTTH
jgi:hypothetical protein